jgi:hypothetical protein
MWIHYLLYKLNKIKRSINGVFESVKNYFTFYDIEEILMNIFFGIILLMLFASIIGLFVSLFNCTV